MVFCCFCHSCYKQMVSKQKHMESWMWKITLTTRQVAHHKNYKHDHLVFLGPVYSVRWAIPVSQAGPICQAGECTGQVAVIFSFISNFFARIRTRNLQYWHNELDIGDAAPINEFLFCFLRDLKQFWHFHKMTNLRNSEILDKPYNSFRECLHFKVTN